MKFNVDCNISFKTQAITGVDETCLKEKDVSAKEALMPRASG